MTQQVKIGPKFFANELKVYRNWVEAFWRENIQNSFDAKAPRIDITIAAEIDGTTEVRFVDNGVGMDRNTLENIYFTLGETTKTGNSVGGFGKARILTCFAQKKYTLRTHKLYVEGCGADYTIEETETFQNGVDLRVEVFTNGKDLLQPLANYLKRSHLNGCSVYINGQRWTEWTYKNKLERRLSFANVYTNKSKEAGILVRVNGVHMFSPYTSAPFLVIVEIDEDKSRKVLQASRDGLLNEFQSELESFVAELNINKQSALRPKKNKSTKYVGTGTFKSRRSKQKEAEQEVEEFVNTLAKNDLTIPDTAVASLIKASPEKRREFIQAALKEHNLIEAEAPAIKHSNGFEDKEDAEQVELDMELFNVLIDDDTSNPKIRKVIETYYPQNWDLLGKNGFRNDKRYGGEARSFRAGVEKYKLLVLWKAACEYAIRLMQDNLQYGSEEISWGVGFTFSDSAQAKFSRDGDGIEYLLINPCKNNGNMRFGISNKRDLIKMISLASHEVCHIVYGDHDERFANLLNDLLEECMANLSDILKHMATAKDEAMKRLDELSTKASLSWASH